MKNYSFFISLLMVMLLSVGNVWADKVTFAFGDYKGKGTTTTGSEYTMVKEDVSIGDTKFYGNNSYAHFYANGVTTITPASGVTITEIVLTASADKYNGYQSSGTMTWSTGSSSVNNAVVTWTGSATAAFTLTHNKQIRWTSIVVTYSKESGGTPTCATPTFDPEDGETFTDDIDVEIACETDGATIYYTTNGSNPTISSNVYSSALNFTATTTLKAMAVKAGYVNSAVAAATYTKVVPFSGSILEIVKGDFTTSSYDDNAGDHEKSGIMFTTAKVYQSGGGIQFQKTNGLLYNKTDLGEIAKIEITTVSGKSNNLVVYSGTTENPTSGAVTGSTSGSVTTYTFAAGKGFFAIKCNSTGASNVDPIKIYYTSATPSSVDKPTISGTESFVTSTTVTISHADADHIYYTTNGDAPTTSSTLYSAPFSLTNTATVKAIAVKGNVSSDVAEKTFTKVEALTTMDAIFAAATTAGSTATDKYITFNNWVVTGVKNSNVYVTDGTKGFIIYQSSHGFAVGDVLNGTVACKVQLYSGAAELTTLTKTTQGLSVSTGGVATINELDAEGIAALSGVNTGSLIKVSGECTTESTNYYIAGVQLYNTLFAFDAPTAGKNYNCSGVYVQFNSTKEMLPRSAADIEEIVEEGAPEAPTFSPAAGTYTEVQSVTLSCETQGATIYYTTDGTTPTSSSAVYSSAISVGETMTIKAIAIKNEIESALATAAYTINLTEDENTSKTWDLSIDETVSASTTELTWTATYVDMVYAKETSTTNANNYYPGTSGKSYTSTRFYTNGVLTITPKNKQITSIVFAATSSSYATALANSTWTNATAVASESNVVVTAAGAGAVSAVIGATCGLKTVRVAYTDVDTSIPAEPTFSLTAGTYTEAQSVTLACETQGATIYYTTDGSTPTNASTQYTTAISVGETMTIKAVAIKDDKSSPVATATYTINLPEDENTAKTWDLTIASYDNDANENKVTWSATYVSMVVDKDKSSTAANNYLGGDANNRTSSRMYKDSKLTITPAGKQITTITFTATSADYATALANSTWTNAAAEANSTTVVVTAAGIGEVSAAIGATCGFTAVRVAYTDIDASIPATPTFSVAAGTYTSAQSVELSCETQGATIYYTLDGSDPDNTKAQYSDAISVEESMTIKAIAIKDDKSSAVATAAYTINIPKLPEEGTGTTYAKITSADNLTNGEYLIVYENVAGSVAFNGALETLDAVSNTVVVIASNGSIAGTESIDNATFTIAAKEGGYSIKSSSNKYIGFTNYNNGLSASDEDAFTNSISFDQDGAVIGITFDAGTITLRYNNTSNQTRFRYYKSGQQAIQLYKKEPDYTRSITAGQFGTICLPDSGRIEGATIFEIAHTKDGKIFFDEISEATMVAGRPYIFYPNNGANELKVYYTGSENAAAGSYNGLYGSYVQSQLAQDEGNYILYDNKYYLVDSEAYVGANRAYIKLGEVPTEEQAPAPGRRRVSMDVQGEQVATSIINTHYGDQPMKVMIDNQLYIIRAGQMFDMTGNKIK